MQVSKKKPPMEELHLGGICHGAPRVLGANSLWALGLMGPNRRNTVRAEDFYPFSKILREIAGLQSNNSGHKDVLRTTITSAKEDLSTLQNREPTLIRARGKKTFFGGLGRLLFMRQDPPHSSNIPKY